MAGSRVAFHARSGTTRTWKSRGRFGGEKDEDQRHARSDGWKGRLRTLAPPVARSSFDPSPVEPIHVLAEDKGEAHVQRLVRSVLEESPCTEDGRPRIEAAVDVVAQLGSLGLGKETVVAGLLADAVHRGVVSLSEVEEAAGASVAALTHDAARLRALPARGAAHDDDSARALRNFCLAFHDARSIFVALAWRLDLMRHSALLPKWRRQQLALETMQIYAPLSHALNAGALRDELEDRAFAVLFPRSYAALAGWMREMDDRDAQILAACESELRSALDEDPRLSDLIQGVRVSVRRKALFSTMRKLLRKKERRSRDVRDRLGMRVVVVPRDTREGPASDRLRAVQACYVVLDVARSLWIHQSDRDKDYIAQPKGNGYQSLHATLHVPMPKKKKKEEEEEETTKERWTGKHEDASSAMERHVRVELQVRTEEMDAVAERGCASHSAYKGEVIPALTTGALLGASHDREEEEEGGGGRREDRGPRGEGIGMDASISSEEDPSISMATDEDGFFSMFGGEWKGGTRMATRARSNDTWTEPDARGGANHGFTQEEFQELQQRLAFLARADARTQVRLQEELAGRGRNATETSESMARGDREAGTERASSAGGRARRRRRRDVPDARTFLRALAERWKPDVSRPGLVLSLSGAVHLQPSAVHGGYVVHAGDGGSSPGTKEIHLPTRGDDPTSTDDVRFVWVCRGNDHHVFPGSPPVQDVRDVLASPSTGIASSYTMVVGYVDRHPPLEKDGKDVWEEERPRPIPGNGGTDGSWTDAMRRGEVDASTLYVTAVGQGPDATLNGTPLAGRRRTEAWIGDTLALGGVAARLTRPGGSKLPMVPCVDLEAACTARSPRAWMRLRHWRAARDAYARALDDPQAKDPAVRSYLMCAWASLEAIHGDAAAADLLYRASVRIALDLPAHADAIDLDLDEELTAPDLNLAEAASRALRGRARLESERGAHRRARALHQRAVWIAPWDVRGYVAYAKALDPKEALEVLRAGGRTAPRSGKLLHARACALARAANEGDDPSMADEARRAFVDAVLASPRRASRWLSFGKFELSRGDLDAAWKRYAVGLRVAPRHLGLLRAAASLARTRGDPGSAEALLRRAWDVDDTDEATLMAMAHLARARGERARADRDFARARKMRKRHRATHGLPPLSMEELPSDVRASVPSPADVRHGATRSTGRPGS